MNPLVESSFSRVWHDGTSPIVFIRLTEIEEGKNLHHITKSILQFAKQLLRANKKVYALIDLSEFVPSSPSVNEYVHLWVSQLHEKCHMHFTAVVNSSREIQRANNLSIENTVNWFSCFEKALQNINTHMMMNLLIH